MPLLFEFMRGIACTGFPRLLKNCGFFFLKFPGPRKSWKMGLVVESPGICLWFNLANMTFDHV